MTMGIGMNLREALDERDMTVAELSRKSGISTNTLYAIIRRDSKKVNTDILEKICNSTGISIFELMYDYDKFPFYDYLAPENAQDKEDAAKKIYDSLNKEDSTLADFIMKSMKEDDMFSDIVNAYHKLNFIGKQEAHKRIRELTEIPRYTELLTGASAATSKLKTEKELTIIEPPEDNT